MEIIQVDLKFRDMTRRDLKSLDKIVLHNAGVVNASAESIHQFHLNRGWAGIGYNFYIRKDGKIYAGRPVEYVPAHAYGHNTKSIGICCEGNFNIEEMNEIQKRALIELVKYVKNKYNILTVVPHRKLNNTSCPGKNFPFDEVVNESNGYVAVKELTERAQQVELQGNELVRRYQKELNIQFGAGLVEDGIFGERTYNASKNIRIGARGNITRIIQEALSNKGYGTAIDGDFGKNTDNQVRAFQNSRGLAVDGIVGKNTIRELLK